MEFCCGKNKDDRLTCLVVGLVSILVFIILSILVYELVTVRLFQTIFGS